MKFDITYYKIYPTRKIITYVLVDAIDQTHAKMLFWRWVKRVFKAKIELLIIKDLK